MNWCWVKGHNWIPWGWSVMGFGPYTYYKRCTKCNTTTISAEPIVESKTTDGPK